MFLDPFLLGISVTSEAKSFHSNWGQEFKLFSSTDIDAILGITNSFHFNRGDFNFFSQHGKAAYAYWGRFVRLSDNQKSACAYDHDEAVLQLFQNLEALLGDPKDLRNRLDVIMKEYDCTCLIELIFPEGLSGALYKIPHSHIEWLAKLEVPFQFRMIHTDMMKELLDRC